MSLMRDTAPARCAEAIVKRVGRDIRLAVPIGIGKPVLLVNALYRLAAANPDLKLTIFTGLTLVRPPHANEIEKRFVQPMLDRLFGSYPDVDYIKAIRGGGLPPNIEVHEFFLQAGAWLKFASTQQSYVSMNYSHVAEHLARLGTNVLAQLVAPEPNGDGTRVSLSSNPDVTLDLMPYVAARRRAGEPVVVAGEINANLPYMPGEAEVESSGFDIMLEPETPHYDLFAPPKEAVPLADYAMALHVAPLIKDGGTLQIGIGSFADALAHVLIMRHTRNREFRSLLAALGEPMPEGADLEPFAAGLYGCSEMLVDGFLHLRRAGVLKRKVEVPARDGRQRHAVVHGGFFVGSRSFYRELREMPREELDEICMTAISFTNTLHGNEELKRRQRRHARFVNSGMVATLLGAVSSDQLEDGRVVSGVGGQFDFVGMAHALPDARSIIALRSTRSRGGQRASNLVWQYGNTTIPRHLRDIIVTEYGVADLRGKPDRDVVAAMLTIADAAFQPQLQKSAMAAGKLEPSFVLPDHARDNHPERIRAALASAKREGLLPPFPFGTDMTETEQSLLMPLSYLKGASRIDLAAAVLTGLMAGEVKPPEQAALQRMGFDEPRNTKERLLRALMLGAMRRTGAATRVD